MYAVTMTSIEYLKERKRETDTDTHTQIDRQTDRQTDRQRDRHCILTRNHYTFLKRIPLQELGHSLEIRGIHISLRIQLFSFLIVVVNLCRYTKKEGIVSCDNHQLFVLIGY